jgi:hypothetical protein
MVRGRRCRPQTNLIGGNQMARASKSERNQPSFADKKSFSPDRANSERIAQFHKNNGGTKGLNKFLNRHLERIEGQDYRKI